MNPFAKDKIVELRKRILFTLFMLGVYRVATQVPTPGVDSAALLSFFNNQQGSLFGIFNTFSGGALERFSILALGIMPYITSSIIFSLLTVSFPSLGEMQKEPGGHKKIQQYTRYATVLLCLIQGYGLAAGLEQLTSNGSSVVINPGMAFRLMTVVSLTGGTMFLMWLGEQITERGIGNGISLIIFAGIAASIPGGIRNTLNLFNNGELNLMTLVIVLGIMFATFWVIIYIERAFRKVPIQYAKKIVHNRVYGGQNSHLPIKINISGVMPPIFAYALMGFPATIARFVPEDSFLGPYVNSIKDSLGQGGVLYTLFLIVCIIFFSYFYAAIQFKTDDVAEMLKKNGGFVPGIRPGEKTVEYFNFIVSRLTLVGAVYVAIICILPTFLFKFSKIPVSFGGTSLLILVGVAMDTMAQIESSLISQRLETAYKSRGKRTLGRRF